MLLKNKSKLLLGLSVVVAGILLAAGWLFYNKIKAASAIVLEAERDIVSFEKKEREFANAISDIENSGKNIAAIKNIYLNEDRFVSFVELLETLALRSGSKFKAESAALPAAGKEPASILFTVEGRFANIFNFISLLDNIPYAGLVENISVRQKAGETKGSGVLTARINYLIFSFRPK